MRTLHFCPVTPVVSSFYLSSFFLTYSQPSQIGYLPHFHTWSGLRSEMCCTWLAENTGRKNRQNGHLRTIAQLCRTMSLQLRHVSTIGKKNVKQQYLSHMSSQYGELRPTSGWDRFGCLGQPSKFASWLRYCSDGTERKPTKLCTMFGRLLGWFTIHTFSGALAS